MNTRSILGHTIAAGLVSAVWETGIHLPAGDPGLPLQAVGVAPFVFAGILLLVGADAQRRSQPVPVPQQKRRPQPARKELVR